MSVIRIVLCRHIVLFIKSHESSPRAFSPFSQCYHYNENTCTYGKVRSLHTSYMERFDRSWVYRLHGALQSENEQMFGYVVTISTVTMALDHNKILYSNSIVKIHPFEWKNFLIIKIDSHSFNLNKKRPFVGIRSQRIYKRPG